MLASISAECHALLNADLHALLLAAPLELEDRDLETVCSSNRRGQRRQTEVETGLRLFEATRDLRKGNVRNEAVELLTGYVTSHTRDMEQRYVGLLTDSAKWHLYHLLHYALHLVSSFTLTPRTQRG